MDLLKENPNRFTLCPIQDNDIWTAYKLQQRAQWTAEELDYKRNQVGNISENERRFNEVFNSEEEN